MTKVAILGSGTVGETLADGFLKHGYSVMRASREPSKLDGWKAKSKGGETGTFGEAAKWGELVVLAVKGTAAEAIVADTADSLAGKVVIDACNPIADAPPQNGVLQYFTSQNESLMERLQKKAGKARFVKAFNSCGAPVMVNPQVPGGTPTHFICGNDASAKQQVSEVLTKFGWAPLDMGPVEAARPLESLCVLWCLPGFLRNDWAHVINYVKLG